VFMEYDQQENEVTLDYCPVCGGQDIFFLIQSNEKQVIRCSGCSVLFVNPRPSEDSIKKLFVEEYIGTDERVTEDFTSWRQSSLARESNILKKLLPSGGHLLDVGTASGAFLGEFSGCEKWKVEGVEPSRFAAKSASDRYGVPVHPGFLRDQKFKDQSFDVVTSLDTIYFHPNPKADLMEISRILKPGGLLAIEIPGLNFRLLKNTGLLCRLIYGVPARLNAGVHLFYYSRETLGYLVAQFGFKEVACYPEQSPLYGKWYARLGNWLYFFLSSALYRISAGRLNIVPKEFIVYRKEN